MSHTKQHFFQTSIPASKLSGNLPHWRQKMVTYFVTFRTNDSLPQEKLNQWVIERHKCLNLHKGNNDDFLDAFANRIDYWLDQNLGDCVLKDKKNELVIENVLKYFDNSRYFLGEFVIMPNHVHIIVTPNNNFNLSDILHSWKSFTAKEINKLMGKTGAIWQKEYFDHIIRSPKHLEKYNEYIRSHKK